MSPSAVGYFRGAVFGLTGELPRKMLEPMLKSNGAMVSAIIHKRVSFVVCTPDAIKYNTQKVRKARKHGIPLVPMEFVKACVAAKKVVDYESYAMLESAEASPASVEAAVASEEREASEKKMRTQGDPKQLESEESRGEGKREVERSGKKRRRQAVGTATGSDGRHSEGSAREGSVSGKEEQVGRGNRRRREDRGGAKRDSGRVAGGKVAPGIHPDPPDVRVEGSRSSHEGGRETIASRSKRHNTKAPIVLEAGKGGGKEVKRDGRGK